MTSADYLRFLGAGSGTLGQAVDFARGLSLFWGRRMRVSIDSPPRTDCGTRLLWSIFEAGAANPYRSHANSGRSTGALSDEQGSARVVGRGEGSGAQKGDERR